MNILTKFGWAVLFAFALLALFVLSFLISVRSQAQTDEEEGDGPRPTMIVVDPHPEPAPPPPAAAGDPLPNRITVLGGYGPDGLVATRQANGPVKVTPSNAPLVGLEYSRLFGRFSVSVEVLGGTSTASRTFIGAGGVGWGF